MKPDWDKLTAEYKGHASILIADVDCTAEGKALCETFGVQGFPTIKYGDPNNLEDHDGGRDLKALQQFAKENLGPTCGPANLDLCDDDKKKQINEFMAMSVDDLKKTITEKDDEIAKLDKDFEESLKDLQSRYEAGQKARDAKKAEIKDSGLGLMKSVKASKTTAKGEL